MKLKNADTQHYNYKKPNYSVVILLVKLHMCYFSILIPGSNYMSGKYLQDINPKVVFVKPRR